jgi:hypothetical protein
MGTWLNESRSEKENDSDLHFYSAVGEACAVASRRSSEAADVMLTAGDTHCELRGELWRSMAPLAEAWLEIASMVFHADLWPPMRRRSPQTMSIWP